MGEGVGIGPGGGVQVILPFPLLCISAYLVSVVVDMVVSCCVVGVVVYVRAFVGLALLFYKVGFVCDSYVLP